MHSLDDTIAATATAPGGAARGVVRLSGHDVAAVVRRVFTPADAVAWDAVHVASRFVGKVAVALAGRGSPQSLPCDLYYWPTERSYTRQPVAELHTFGSPPLLDALLRTVCGAGARLAEPGEFTLRAFLAGRIDLVQAEAVLGVIDAADSRHLGAALAQLAGGLSRPLAAVRDDLLNLLADVEAGLDFVEEDIRFLSSADLDDRLRKAIAAIADIAEQMNARSEADYELRIALVGSPNVGKSSLFNALAAGGMALVSDEAGTTRDYLTSKLDLDGITCLLIDTAGQDAEVVDGSIASAAQAFVHEQRESADLRLLCIDSTRPVNAWETEQLRSEDRGLVVLTKCDLQGSAPAPDDAILTSVATGFGLGALRSAIRIRLSAAATETSRAAVVAATAVRCRESLRVAADSLRRAAQIAAAHRGDELVAAEIRVALIELGKVVGAVYTDDLLDRIFSRFCIGK